MVRQAHHEAVYSKDRWYQSINLAPAFLRLKLNAG
jgi:hypothetical protein